MFLLICSTGTFHSLARISSTFGPQKPPWQRPIPALRRFTASMLLAPRGLLIQSKISPSVMVLLFADLTWVRWIYCADCSFSLLSFAWKHTIPYMFSYNFL